VPSHRFRCLLLPLRKVWNRHCAGSAGLFDGDLELCRAVLAFQNQRVGADAFQLLIMRFQLGARAVQYLIRQHV
jgi:hypothetical protein